MEFLAVKRLEDRKNADLIVVPFWKGKKHAENAASIGKLSAYAEEPIHAGDFIGKEGEVLILYSKGNPDKRIALLGLGEKEKVTVEKLRRAYACLTKACRPRKVQEINLLLPVVSSLAEEEVVRGVSEGLLLANYVFNKRKNDSIKEDPVKLLKKTTFVGASKEAVSIANKYNTIVEAVYFARDIVNDNADTVTPQFLANAAKNLSKLKNVKTTIFDKKRIEKEKMGFILAVNRGSTSGPTFSIIEYKGNPKSKETTVLIGKGITYDTGGLHLKPLNSMDTMRCDMGGAAVVLGTLQAAATLGLKVNITGIIPATENSISADSYKPGDVYSSMTGKTVEITSTDAEGRLVLADAIAYAVKHLKPTRIIDFATLTGGVEIALGSEVTGVVSNNDALVDAMSLAGHATYERIWRLPSYDEYREFLKSDSADMKNSAGRSASPIMGGMFLREFVEDTPWLHCDIASTAFLSEAKRYHPKHATGVGVRLMIEFFENQ
jgi:leucyl aminopeptidase